MSQELPTQKLVDMYIKIRTAKARASAEAKKTDGEFKSQMEMIENELLARADAEGVNGFKVNGATTFKEEHLKVSIADDSAFFAFVIEQKDLDFFERRVSSTHVKDYMKISDGVPPPGLNLFREFGMTVRQV